ncbi:hypothetical protein GP486_007377, partial [Trichoglossum hirsutum]
MSAGRTVVDSEDEEQDLHLSPPGSSPAAQASTVDISNSSPDAPPAPDPSAETSTTSTTLSKEALNRSIHNAHFALVEPTPDAKATSATVHPDIQPSAPSPLLSRVKRGNTSSKLDPPARDEFTFIASSASEFSPPPAKRMRGKTMGATTAKTKDRKPKRSKSTGQTPDAVVEEESDTWEPANASKLLGEPTGLRRTRGMGDDGVVEGLPKPKRPKRNATPKEPVNTEIRIDLTSDSAALSTTQKQEYERISISSSSPPHKPPAMPGSRTSVAGPERDPEESSTIPFSSSPPIPDRLSERAKLGSKFEEPQIANLPSSSVASASASRALKNYSKMRRARTVTGAGNEHLDRAFSGDEFSLGSKRKNHRGKRASKSPEELDSKKETKGVRTSSSSVAPGGYTSGEDELGLEGIEIEKERYRPRPSRSRGGGVDVVELSSTGMEPPKPRPGSKKHDIQPPVSAMPSEPKLKPHPDDIETDASSRVKSPAALKATETDDSEFDHPTKAVARPKRKKSTVVVQEDDDDDNDDADYDTSLDQGTNNSNHTPLPTKPKQKKRL